MMGVPGFSYKLPELPQWVLERFRELGEFYTKYSTDFILKGDAYRLTEQPLSGGQGERYPVFEFVDSKKRGLVFAFRLIGGPETKSVCLKGLDPGREYTVSWLDQGAELRATGAQLMDQGVVFDSLPEEGSEILTIFYS